MAADRTLYSGGGEKKRKDGDSRQVAQNCIYINKTVPLIIFDREQTKTANTTINLINSEPLKLYKKYINILIDIDLQFCNFLFYFLYFSVFVSFLTSFVEPISQLFEPKEISFYLIILVSRLKWLRLQF